MFKFQGTILLLSLSTVLLGQSNSPSALLKKKADSLYRVKDYLHATHYYVQHAHTSDFNITRASSLYNAACCVALQQKPDSAFILLQQAIASGYNNRDGLLQDTDFDGLRNDPRWTKIVEQMKAVKKLNENPVKARFVTTDIDRFWKAYDKALKDTAHFRSIFVHDYFDKASDGMQDYMGYKVSSIDYFVNHIKACPEFYQSIRNNTLRVKEYKKQFYAAFRKMKELYPPAKFPDVYFVIGAFTSGGTVSDNGLLIGVNQNVQTDEVLTGELSFAQRTRINKMETLPGLIAHELIHFQQKNLAKDTITLGYAILEGMADFLGELISGSTPNTSLYEWAKGKEKLIWKRFQADMYFNRYSNWIANSSQATADNPPDQGYWIGYQICRAYYEKATDKKQAIAELLNIKDYRQFLEQSGWEEKLEGMR